MLKQKLVDQGVQYSTNDIITDMKNNYGVELSKEKAWRCREAALDLVRGTPEDAYTKLPSYLYMLAQRNPGTVYHVQTTEAGNFKYCFFAIGACLRGFTHCRPLICLDGSALKHRYGGTLLAAVAMDADDRVLPLAFGIVDVEDNSSWTYFLRLLKHAIGDVDDLVIVTDRHLSLEETISPIFPDAHHGICYKHLQTNVKAKHGVERLNAIEAYMSQAAYSHLRHVTDSLMEEIRAREPRVYIYLREVGLERWARSYFPGSRYDIMTTNYVESFNATTREARKWPVSSLLEFIRQKIQQWFYERREAASQWKSKLSPRREADLGRVKNVGKHLLPRGIDMHTFLVNDVDGQWEVDINQKVCTCMRFQQLGMPCPHAYAVCKTRRIDLYLMCSPYFMKETVQAAYSENIYPVGSEAEWNVPEEIGSTIVTVPEPRTRAGRPSRLGRRKTARIPSQGERAMRKCSRCGEYGHNRSTCKTTL